MKTKLFNILILLISFAPSQVKALSLPERGLGRPIVFQKEDRSWNWQSIAEKRNFGDYSQNLWYVYVMNENAKVYETPSKNNSVGSLSFMDQFLVADMSGDFLLLYYNDSPSTSDGLTIPKKIRTTKSSVDANGVRSNGYIGWVCIDDLLLWNICPRTQQGVYQKIAIVKDASILSNNSLQKSAKLFKDAKCTIPKGGVSPLEFYFAYYYDRQTGNVLVYTGSETKDHKLANQRVGWIEKDEYIKWNTRVCWEPAFRTESMSINDKAYTYESHGAAQSNDANKIISATPLDGRRKKNDFPRSPVLDYSRGVAELAVIGNFKGNQSTMDPMEVQRKIEALESSLSNINVVFVMDASNSMRACFNAMSAAVGDIVKSKDYKDNKVRFGVVVYRNYTDESKGRLVGSLPLTTDPNQVISFLNGTECRSDEHNDPQEAMFYGLKYAVDNMKWTNNGSNFIILVGDVTNHIPDKKGITQQKLVDALAAKDINLVAFQARSQPEAVYIDFSAQVGDIISGLLKKEGYGAAKPVKTKHQTFMYDQKAKFPFRPMGFKWKNSSDQTINSSELTDMVVGTIKLFINKTEDNLGALKNVIGSDPDDGDGNTSICEYLKEKGVIRDCKDLRGAIKVKGYTRREYDYNADKQMFTPCIFMADKELTELIQNLENAMKSSSSNRRAELQKQCLSMILLYTGQQELTGTQLNDPNIGTIIQSIEEECGYQFYPDVKKHIKNPNVLSDSDFEILCNRLRTEITFLRKKQADPTTYFSQNGLKYYYVHLDAMPLIKQN